MKSAIISGFTDAEAFWEDNADRGGHFCRRFLQVKAHDLSVIESGQAVNFQYARAFPNSERSNGDISYTFLIKICWSSPWGLESFYNSWDWYDLQSVLEASLKWGEHE